MASFNNLNQVILKELNRIKFLHQNIDSEIVISGGKNDGKIDYFLKFLRIKNCPKENLWIYEAEYKPKGENAKWLNLGGKCTEKALIYLSDNQLYIFLIELKSSPKNKAKLEEVYEKFETSLAQSSLFIAGCLYNSSDIQVFPIGILVFNKESFRTSDRDENSDLTMLFKNWQTHKTNYGLLPLQPVTLGRRTIPILFLQNPDFQNNTNATSSEFSIDFHDILQKIN